ncbi:SICA antigen [Plasmodium coatneyi]|uniref:SICA antigen n=1 Tax=Plasmodium coatneyi TaxID=208452 RepID=A0A1B1DWC6_9APIC|nr:SICA antigen [Plasmodium coatneyi]ANQ07054.1 SICA antigen [Plasmodium coatneyi]
MLKELGEYLNKEPTNIKELCAKVKLEDGQNEGQVKGICKALVKIVYWMEGKGKWARNRKDEGCEKNFIECLRCKIGKEAMVGILKNKCRTEGIMEILSGTINGKTNIEKMEDVQNICECTQFKDKKFKGETIEERMKKWIKERERGDAGFSRIINWDLKCPKKGKTKEAKSQEQPTHQTTAEGTAHDSREGASSSVSGHISTSSSSSGAAGATVLPAPIPVFHRTYNPNFTPYLPTVPVVIGLSAMAYLLWKYFGMLRKTRKRYRRAHQLRGPLPLEQQIVDHVHEQGDGQREYYLVKERKPRSVPTRTKRSKKQGVDRRVCHRTIIDIHLEVLDECQKGGLHSTKEDFFKILVREFMGSELIKKVFVPKEQVPSSGCGFREKDSVPKQDVPSSDSRLMEEDFLPNEGVPKDEVPKEQVPCSDSGFREERICS